jgi:hypothetical protein
MKIAVLFAAIAIVTIIIIAYKVQFRHSVTDDGREWNLSGYDNDSDAAALMSRANDRMMKLMCHLKKKYSVDMIGELPTDKLHYSLRQICIDNLLDHYNPDNFYENDPKKIGTETSYTLSKGSAMYICLRSKSDPEKLVDINTLMFVLLHESSHIANPGWGHTPIFWSIFKFILIEAVECGIYKTEDYQKNPKMYCGLSIDYNPILDVNRPAI